MEISYIIGISGAVLLIIAWAVSLVRTLRSKVNTIDPFFTGIYLVASALLTAYSLAIADHVFAVLNGTATAIALVEYCAYFHYRKAALLL